MTVGHLQKRGKSELAKYDPHKGIKTIAVLEMAEKHYARAKDAEKLKLAIREKLEAQAEFVFWWDTQAEKAAGRPQKINPDRSVRVFAGRDGLPDSTTIHRWRTKLNPADKFEQTYENVCAKYPKLIEFITTAHVGYNSGENEWYTPQDIIEAAREVLGDIDLDPATSHAANKIVKAAQIFTAEDSGLDASWHGRVWMNPPYSQPLVQDFTDKLAAHVVAGDVTAAIVLINNATETEFFQRLASVCAALSFPKGRVRFWSPAKDSATPLQGQAILYAGPDSDVFIRRFRQFGITATITGRSV